MTKNQLITAVAKKTSYTKKQTEEVFTAVIDTIIEQLAADESVQITGFGTFEVRHYGERNGHNPFSGEPMKISASRRPAFVPGKALKDKIK